MNPIKQEFENIPVPDEVMAAMYKGIQQAKKEENVTEMNPVVKKKRKKLIGTLAGLAAVGTLLFGSTFVTPAMAKMAEKIPFLKDVFLKTETQPLGTLPEKNQKPVFETLREEALKMGINIQTMGMGWEQIGDDPDTVVIQLEDTSYNLENKTKVEKLLNDILDEKGYYAKSIETIPVNEDLYKSMIRINLIIKQQAKEMEKLIKEKGYQVDFVGMNRQMKEIFVILPETETHVNEIRAIIQSYQKENYNEFPLDIRTQMDADTKLKRDLYTIFEDLVSKKDYQVEYFKFSTEGQLVITIKASIDTFDKEQLKKATQIRNEVKAALDKEYAQPYTLQILGINDEQIK
ncbi:hypothetical protein QE429_000505 [Bacillus sp. SORGH_AS 510]|uniref:DUF4179 domain-containing protein n=1 Tax=Bacillus sp. SORGH_AS_0510 TaxID=3041771 RepID=UPI0027872CE3|nr:DUF4179 domain-containing protein [Bacillus sp. SORGH_AS_0510]MDQ1143678.1 hypothetical protein [Bacillus sp. SORGH_AS_0510]